MPFIRMLDTAAAFQWKDLLLPSLILAAVSWIWVVLRPALARLVIYLLRYDQPRTHDFVFDLLGSDLGRVRTKAFVDDLYADEIKHRTKSVSAAIEIAEANRDRLTMVEQSVEMQGVAIQKISDSVRDVPKLADAIDRISRSLESFAGEMKIVNETMIRLEERSNEERRRRNVPGSPRRRATDDSDG